MEQDAVEQSIRAWFALGETMWFRGNVEHLLATLDQVRARLASVEAFDASVDAVNGLPERLRWYIHDLETRCDPAGDVRRVFFAKQEVTALRARLAEVERENTDARELIGRFMAGESEAREAARRILAHDE